MAYLLKSVGGLVGAAYQAEFAHLALAASTQYPVQYVDIHVYVSAELSRIACQKARINGVPWPATGIALRSPLASDDYPLLD